jgi:L-iditol 2-dehydrogenase
MVIDRWHNDGFDIRTLALMHRIMLDRRWWIDKTMEIVADGLVNIDALLTHRFPFKDVQKAFETACTDDTAVKVGIDC